MMFVKNSPSLTALVLMMINKQHKRSKKELKGMRHILMISSIIDEEHLFINFPTNKTSQTHAGHKNT